MDILELSGKSLCLHLVSGPAFTPYPSLSAFGKVRQFLLNLSMNVSAFNAQGSSLIIVVVQVGPVKIYVAAMKEKEKTG